MIGHRLRLARAGSGYSLRQLEQQIGRRVSAQAIGKYERDEAMPGSDVLIKLSNALSVPVEYLLGDADVSLKAVEFRKKRITSKKEEAQVSARVLYLLERYLTVEDILGLKSIDWDQPLGSPYPIHSIAEAETAARTVRDHWGLGLDPIPRLVDVLEERGVKVLADELSGLDGLTARVKRAHSSDLPVIVVNKDDWGERQRFTLAHELGHMVMEPMDSSKEDEKAAHRFAGAFLMPGEALWSEIGKHRKAISVGELLKLKELFGVSIQAITYRCYDLGIFPKKLFGALFDEFEHRGWRSSPFHEPGALSPEHERPERFERLCYRALAEGAISESKAAELLEISTRDLENRMDALDAA